MHLTIWTDKGWDCDIEDFKPIAEALKKNTTLIWVDFTACSNYNFHYFTDTLKVNTTLLNLYHDLPECESDIQIWQLV
jgi:hypothetical protein